MTILLIYQILSKIVHFRTISEKMRSGENIAPELYDLVTLAYFDVVSFTSIATKCTPVQVVDFINDFYGRFDQTIEAFDVYKVCVFAVSTHILLA